MRSTAIVIALTAAPALAVVTGTTGSAAVAPIPASLTLGAFESDSQARIMFERSRNLPEGQEVDIRQPGLVDQTTDLTPGLIPAGTAVRSYILHADSVGRTSRMRRERERQESQQPPLEHRPPPVGSQTQKNQSGQGQFGVG